MASVDDIFKSSGYSAKRKLEPARDPNELYKAAKVNNESPRDGDQNGADEEEDYGPAMPDEVADDEDRFFGGGITKHESEILDFVEGADDADVKIDTAWLRKTALNFEKKITKNAELRAKYEDDPQKFIGSEADLDADIKGLSVLSEHPDLYVEFARLGCVGSLVGLLTHENTDIAIDAVEIMGELTDEDVDAEEEQWNALADALLDADLLALLISNLSRLNEEDESDRSGVYHVLGLVENICSRPQTAARVGEEQGLLQWLLSRLQRKESSVTQNKQYAAEILAILAQASEKTRSRLVELDAVDTLLQLVAPYRRQDPERGSEEEEYMENVFESITCLVESAEGRIKFVDAEGLELCLIMIKDGKMSRTPALRLVDHAVGGVDAEVVRVCQKLVETGGLKTLFTLFMKKTTDQRVTRSLLSIFASLLRLLPADSGERIRTLAKFVEKEYGKIDKLISLRRDLAARVKRAEAEPGEGETEEEREVDLLARRLDAGLFSLQLTDQILAWLVAEDRGAAKAIKRLLSAVDEDLGIIKATLQEQSDGLDLSDERNQDTKDMLGTLVSFL